MSLARRKLMDPTTIAVGVSAFLGPFLPYLVKGGEEAAKEAGKKFGAAGWERARTLWGKLESKVDATPGAKTAVGRATERPDDKRVIGALELELEDLLKKYPELASELARELEDAKAAGVTVTASGERNIAVGGSVTGSTLTTGDQPRSPNQGRR
jgi:hypothetical protein